MKKVNNWHYIIRLLNYWYIPFIKNNHQVVMVEEIEFDTEIKCQHVSQESCFESYTTTFKKTQVRFRANLRTIGIFYMYLLASTASTVHLANNLYFVFVQAEECDESFKKECEIEYFKVRNTVILTKLQFVYIICIDIKIIEYAILKVPKEEKVQTCNEMLTRNCEIDGPIVCSKEYETGSITKVHNSAVYTQLMSVCSL